TAYPAGVDADRGVLAQCDRSALRRHQAGHALRLGRSRPRPSPTPRLSVPALPQLPRRTGGSSVDSHPLHSPEQVAAALGVAMFRLIAEGNRHPHGQAAQSDRLLTPDSAAMRFGVTKRWLLEQAVEIPGVKRLSRKTICFSERRLGRFLEKPTA